MFVAIVLAITVLYLGGFTAASKFVSVFLLMGYLLWQSMGKKNKLAFRIGVEEILFLLSALTTVWAVERGRNLVGCLTLLGVVLMKGILLSADETTTKKGHENIREEIFRWLVMVGCAMTLVSVLAFPIPAAKELLWRANRMGGFFQYSNTCALFLLICLIFESFFPLAKKWQHFLVQGILLLGILLTGSRTIMILMIVWGIYTALTRKALAKIMAFFGAGAVVLAMVIFAVTGSLQNAGRLATVFTSNSTFWGRLLYYQDALGILAKHPLGLGYLGYYDVQGMYQHGVYTTMFVHNEYLQMALDHGILAGIILLVYIFLQIFKGKQEKYKKEMLITIGLASVVDFHLQYMIMALVVVLCLDLDMELPYLNKKYVVDKKMGTATGCLFTGIVVISSIAIAYSLNSVDAMMEELNETTDIKEASALIDKCLSKNQYNKQAWFYKSYAALMEGDYEEALYCQDKLIELGAYDVQRYEVYDGFLDEAATRVMAGSGSDQEKDEWMAVFEKKKIENREYLAALEKTTSPLAYKTRDIPIFTY